MSPFKSPPTKVRVGDKDQRVWNDDDDLVAEDVFDALDLDEDDLDDDYEPPIYISNPWSRSLQNRGRQREPVCIVSDFCIHKCFHSEKFSAVFSYSLV